MLLLLRQTLAVALLALGATRHAFAHEHHHHEDEAATSVPKSPWESAATYDLAAGNHTLKLCATTGDVVADGGMIFALLTLESSSDSAASAATTRAEAIFSTFASDEVVHERVTSGKTLRIKTNASSPDVLYRAEFAREQICVDATVPVARAGAFMLFAQHGSDEVSVAVTDAKAQPVAVLKCYAGCDEHEHDEDHAHSDNWLGPIAASLIISLTSFVGVVILGMSKHRIESVVEYMTSFAAGCLLGVVVFHLYPEGSEYLVDLGEWVMGVWVLGGIAFSMAVESGVHMVLSAFGAEHNHAHGGHAHGEHDHAHASADAEKGLVRLSLQGVGAEYVAHPPTPMPMLAPDVATSSGESGESGEKFGASQSFSAKYFASLKFVEPVAWITAVGDFFHAFTDGVVLAVAFKSCSASLGWAVALGVVLHEVPHRVGDFFIYIKAGMLVSQALVVNFVASLASLIGAVILLAAGSVSNHALGFLMGFGCGALMFIGLSVLLPPMLAVRDRRRAALHFFWFSLGCVLIGLSVLQHTHCEVGESSSSSEHRH